MCVQKTTIERDTLEQCLHRGSHSYRKVPPNYHNKRVYRKLRTRKNLSIEDLIVIERYLLITTINVCTENYLKGTRSSSVLEDHHSYRKVPPFHINVYRKLPLKGTRSSSVYIEDHIVYCGN